MRNNSRTGGKEIAWLWMSGKIWDTNKEERKMGRGIAKKSRGVGSNKNFLRLSLSGRIEGSKYGSRYLSLIWSIHGRGLFVDW